MGPLPTAFCDGKPWISRSILCRWPLSRIGADQRRIGGVITLHSDSAQLRVHPEPLAAVAQPQDQTDQDRTGCCQKGDSHRELPVLLVLRRSDHPEEVSLDTYPRLCRFCKAHLNSSSQSRFSPWTATTRDFGGRSSAQALARCTRLCDGWGCFSLFRGECSPPRRSG